MVPTRYTAALSALALTAALAGCAGAPGSDDTSAPSADFAPVTLDNCGEKVEVTTAPTKLVTLNQGATEVALALGLQDRMAGTAYLDDEISPQWDDQYHEVSVLAKEYPTKEKFLAADPDLAYAAYSSAFTDKAVGTRDELKSEGINSYLSPFGCPEGEKKADPTFESAWEEIRQVGQLFGVTDRADDVIDQQKKELDGIRQEAPGKDFTVFWFDSGDKTPFVGAGGGGPQLILDAVGATNVFADLEGGWADGTWEKVVEANPEVIVLAEASWSSAQSKQKYLESDPVLKDLDAVKAKRYIVVPFSATTPGVRLVEGAQTVAKGLAERS